METTLIWKRLLVDGRKIVTSRDIRELASELGKDEWRSVKYLQTQGYLIRILRGIFYVRSPDERERGRSYPPIFELVGMAMDEKGVENWYFALESGLKLNTLTHEYFAIEYVITDSYRTTKVIRIADNEFKFIRRNERFFGFGIIDEKNFHYSDPERTILDLMYRNYLKGARGGYLLGPLREYQEQLDINRFRNHLVNYPRRFRTIVETEL